MGNIEGEVVGSELNLSEVRKLGDAHLPSAGGVGVVLLNLEEVFEEDSLSVLFLSLTSVGLSEVLLEL